MIDTRYDIHENNKSSIRWLRVSKRMQTDEDFPMLTWTRSLKQRNVVQHTQFEMRLFCIWNLTDSRYEMYCFAQ